MSKPKYKPMDIMSAPGSKVVFQWPKNGYDGDIETAKKHGLKKGREYAIESISAGGFYTSVKLVGIPCARFNSVQFRNA